MFDNPATRRTPRYSVYRYVLAAGEGWTIDGVDSEFCACLEATADFKIGFDAPPGSDFKKGLNFGEPGGFMQVRILNTSAAANTIELAIGRGSFKDARLNISGSIRNSAISPDVFTTPPKVSAPATANALIVAANTARKEVMIVNEGTAKIYLLGDTTAAADGLPLAGGGNVTLTTTAAIYVYNPDAAAQDVYAVELEVSP